MTHDPGGKSKFPLPPGVMGWADISACGRYRPRLHRIWDDALPRILWIGMNPSTAEGNVDDPTVRREYLYSRNRLGAGAYLKANVMDYRATNPKQLLHLPFEERCSDYNLSVIKTLASMASHVICAWGMLPKRLRGHAEAVEHALADRELCCVGLTKDGSPRHPLYVRGDAPLIPYKKES